MARALEDVKAIDKQIKDLEAEIESQVREITSSTEALSEKLETVTLKPKSTGVTVRVLSLVWVPS